MFRTSPSVCCLAALVCVLTVCADRKTSGADLPLLPPRAHLREPMVAPAPPPIAQVPPSIHDTTSLPAAPADHQPSAASAAEMVTPAPAVEGAGGQGRPPRPSPKASVTLDGRAPLARSLVSNAPVDNDSCLAR